MKEDIIKKAEELIKKLDKTKEEKPTQIFYITWELFTPEPQGPRKKDVHGKSKNEVKQKYSAIFENMKKNNQITHYTLLVQTFEEHHTMLHTK